jgi:hypothetical protein
MTDTQAEMTRQIFTIGPSHFEVWSVDAAGQQVRFHARFASHGMAVLYLSGRLNQAATGDRA